MANKTKEVQLNIDEMKGFIRHIVKNNEFLQSQGKPSVSVEVVGESGIGKTSSALQLAAEFNTPDKPFHVVKLNLAQIEEIGDLVGFPIRQFEMCVYELQPGKKTVMKMTEGAMKPVEVEDETAPAMRVKTKCLWVDENAVSDYSRHGYEFTGAKRMSYCPPEWIAGKEGGGFLILDDWNRADMRFIQACMELVDRQEYISWKLPKGWTILLTANPEDGTYLVNSIDPAQRTRFIRTNLKFDVEIWGRWAEREKIDTRCINFLLMHPELVKSEINPRSIVMFFNSISSIKDFSDPKSLALIQMIGEGSVGPEFSTLFTTFIHNKLDRLPTPGEIMSADTHEKALGKIRAAAGTKKKGDYDAAVASVLASRIINYNLLVAETTPVDKGTIERLVELVTDEHTFSNDLCYFMTKTLLNGNHKFKPMMMSEKVMDMSTK